MINTIDIHAHLLSPNLEFDRFYDKVALLFFAKRLGIEDIDDLKKNPFSNYKKLFIQNLRNSKYVQKSVIFPVDPRIDKKGNIIHKDQTVCSDSEDVWDFYKEYKEEIIPFFSINPLRKDALEKIDEYSKRGFKGAKFLQNYWDIDSNNRSFIPYYEKLLEYDLPLVIHTGLEFGMHSTKAYESVDMVKLPASMGVKTIAAHFGLNIIKDIRFWRNFSTNPKYYDKSYFKLIKILKTYPTLYADLSAVINPIRSRVLEDLALNHKDIHHKILFGTDYPVPFSPYFASSISFKQRKELSNIKNPLDCYVQTLKAYFKEDDQIFLNYKKILNL